jgi:hypothetical protein
MGKHRTEVTEVTEGDRRLGGETICRRYHRSGARNTRKGKASHRGHRGHRGGIGGWGAKLLAGDITALVRETRAKGKASHRGHRGHRGGLGLGRRNYLPGIPPLPVRETRAKGKHRTEVTEGGWGCWANVLPCYLGHRWPGCEKNRRSAFRVLQSRSLSFVFR